MTPINFNEHPFAPSGIKHIPLVRGFLTYGDPKELTKEQIKTEVVDNFVYAAKYCQEIGKIYSAPCPYPSMHTKIPKNRPVLISC